MSRLFPGGAATDRIETALTSNSSLRSYSIWSYRIGDGGGGAGRMFNKGTTGTTEYLTNVSSTDSYDYSRFWTGGASWRVPRPSANAWHLIQVTYDSSSSSNLPVIYIDCVSQTVTPNSSPSGSPQDNAEPFVLGQRASDNAREWEGMLAEFGTWNRILSFDELIGLQNGNPAWKYSDQLACYIPMNGASTADRVLSAPTVTGTSEAVDPPIHRAFHTNQLRPRIFAPGLAR